MIDQVSGLDCPIAFHYGNSDPFIPAENIAAVEDAVSGRTDIEFFRYEAGHAFSNWDAPSMYNQAAADLAWSRTLDFFARHLTSSSR
jgi:carboxymethylenebutenolidase